MLLPRELRIKTGEILFSEKDRGTSRQVKTGSAIFEPVAVPSFYLNPKNEGVLVVNIKEKETNNFDGIIGYVPGTGTDQTGYLTGLVNVTLRNLFGTGARGSFRWQQLDRNYRNSKFIIWNHGSWGFPFNLTRFFIPEEAGFVICRKKNNRQCEFLATEDLSASLDLASDCNHSDNQRYVCSDVFRSSSLTTGISLKYDTPR